MRYNQLTVVRLKHFTERAFLLRLLGLYALLCGALCLSPLTPTAHADGGAPNLAYIAGSASGISVIDIAQQKVIHDIQLGGTPSMVYLSLDGGYIYAAQPGAGTVSKISTSTRKTVCSVNVPGQPSLLVFDPGINTLYVAGGKAPGITAIDGDNCKIKRTIQTSSIVYGMFVAIVGPGTNGGDANQLWFTTDTALNILTQPDKIQIISIPAGPQYLTIPPGATVYVTTRQGTVVAVSLQSFQVTSPLLTGGDFGPMDFDEFTQEVYVPDRKHNLIDVLTPIYYGSSAPKEPNHVINMQTAPESVAVTSDGNLAFFALADGSVQMYDILGKSVVKTISVGGDPRFIITGLYPPQVRNSPQTNANGSAIPGNALAIIAIIALVILLAIVLLIVLARRKQ